MLLGVLLVGFQVVVFCWFSCFCVWVGLKRVFGPRVVSTAISTAKFV